MTNIRDLLYLGALLQDVPNEAVQQKWHTFLKAASGAESEQIKRILQEAKKLATGQSERNEQQHVYSVFESLLTFSSKEPSYYFPKRALQLKQPAFPKKAEQEEVGEEQLWKEFAEVLANVPTAQITVFAETTLHLLHQYAVFLPHEAAPVPAVSFYDYVKSVAGIAVCLYDFYEVTGKNSVAAEETPFLLIGADVSGIQSFLYGIVSKHASKNLKGRSFYLELLVDSILQKLLQELRLYQGNVIYASGGSFFLLAPNTEQSRQIFYDTSENTESLEYQIIKKLYHTHKDRLAVLLDCVPITYTKMQEAQLQHCMSELISEKLAKKKKQRFLPLLQKQHEMFFGDAVELGGDTARDVITGDEISKEEIEHKQFWYLDSKSKKFIRPAEDTKVDSGKEPMKKETAQQIISGKNIKNFKYWITSLDKLLTVPIDDDYIFEMNPCDLGVYHYLIPDNRTSDFQAELVKEKNQVTVKSIRTIENFVLLEDFGSPYAYGFSFYGGNDYPSDQFEPKTFSEFTGTIDEEKRERYKIHDRTYPIKPEDEPDFKRLAILRMDVDNLGSIISQGFGERSTLAQYSTLSRSLDFFFKGYLNRIWEAQNKEDKNFAFKDHTQIIYSGGDDLFIVGRWDLMVQFAKRIKEDFEEWTCHNPYLSLSGGISIVTHKFPVIKAARMAEDAEKDAKLHLRFEKERWKLEFEKKENQSQESGEKRETDEQRKERLRNQRELNRLQKNSFTLFDKPLHWTKTENVIITETVEEKVIEKKYNWSNEFAIVEELKNEFVELIKAEKGLPRSILRKIQTLHEMYVFCKRAEQSSKKVNPRWRWMITYELSQLTTRRRNSTAKEKYLLEGLSNQFLHQVASNTFLQRYKHEPLESAYSFMELLNLAARWAELELRTINNFKKESQTMTYG